MTKVATAPNGTPRDTIVKVATELFGTRSYPATSMREIASEVGILAGSLYAHIDGKETLLLEIIQGGIAEFLDAARAGAEHHDSAEDKLRAMILAHIRVVAQHPQMTLIVFHQWRYLSEQPQKVVREERAAYQRLFTEVLEAGVADGSFSGAMDVPVTVLSILGTLNWTPEWLSPEGSIPIEEIGRRLSDSILNGVLGR